VQRRQDESEPLIQIEEVVIVETQAAALAPPATVDGDSLKREIFAALAEVRRNSGPGSNRCNTSHSIGNDQHQLRRRGHGQLRDDGRRVCRDRIVDIADNLDRKVARTSEEQRTTLDRECAVTEQELVQLEADSNARVGPGASHYDDAELELAIADAEALAAAHIAAPHPKTSDPIFAPLLLPPPVVDISNLCC